MVHCLCVRNQQILRNRGGRLVVSCLKRSGANGGVYRSVVGLFCEGKELIPLSWFIMNEAPLILFQNAIKNLSQSVCSRWYEVLMQSLVPQSLNSSRQS